MYYTHKMTTVRMYFSTKCNFFDYFANFAISVLLYDNAIVCHVAQSSDTLACKARDGT